MLFDNIRLISKNKIRILDHENTVKNVNGNLVKVFI